MPRLVMFEQDISQDGPQKAWLRILCLILAQKLHNGSNIEQRCTAPKGPHAQASQKADR